jgi:diadenosine tetraphosphate (Ap4A) HIT family hydrolase
VNIRPVVPGHVLVLPRRRVPRLSRLTPAEMADLWATAQRVSAALERVHCADGMSLAVQDGPAAGQTVPHVHIHLLPRRRGDLANNDEIYDMIDESERAQTAVGRAEASLHPGRRPSGKTPAVDPLAGQSQLPPETAAAATTIPVQAPRFRTMEEMQAEASAYRQAALLRPNHGDTPSSC